MKARSIILAAAGAIAVMAAIPDAEANGYHRGHGYERPHWRPHYPQSHYPQPHWRPYGYYAPPRVYYAPPPVYYPPPPAVYFGYRGW